MDRLVVFLQDAREHTRLKGQFRGLLHLLIGRRISVPDGPVISTGLTWRSAAHLLRKARWDKAAVAELGLEVKDLPPRDREKYWYTAIAKAQIDSPEALRSAEQLAVQLKRAGYVISAAP